MADESLLERLVHLKSMVDEVLGDPPIGDDASSPALLDAYMRIRREVGTFVSSLGADDQENLGGESDSYESALDRDFGRSFPYLRGRARDPAEAEFNLRRLGDWLQHLIEVETLAQQWGGTGKAYKAAHLQLGPFPHPRQ